jgi:ectoine hydroxylase-related dioxygenase (phytanoyl-CoA dioxygenase family)
VSGIDLKLGWEGATQPAIARADANDPATTAEKLTKIIERDGGVIVENLITSELTARIKEELAPVFAADQGDRSGFFPSTTQRATALLAHSEGCAELLTAPLFIDVANAFLTSTFSFWQSQTRYTVQTKPIISSTVGFRVNPGGKQQVLHRDNMYVQEILWSSSGPNMATATIMVEKLMDQ